MKTTVILANGDFPRKGSAARRLLESAGRIVACDGAADALRRRLGREADFIVGDLDSCRVRRGQTDARVVHIAEQDTNDLEKAVRFCRGRGWKRLVVVGATGGRDDHALGNVFRAMALGVEMITDTGRFIPFAGRLRLRVGKGAPVSVFATDRRTRMTSKGLVWPLDAVRFENLYCATLNRASRSTVEICSDRPAFVWV